jgi:monomeric sarcosine oxidase
MQKIHVAVIGAGAFGGWTALHLLRAGATVTLLDAWGAGNSRSSSGGETRIIRGTYGPDQPYTKMAARALHLWKENQVRWACRLFHPAGVLWMASDGDDEFERASLPLLGQFGFDHEELSVQELRRRWPQINVEDIRWAIYEPDSGYLTARAACQRVQQAFVEEGGCYRQLAAQPSGNLDALALSDGSKLSADHYVFACGPWLGQLFRDAIGDRIFSTKQDVFFFGTPPGDDRFSEGKLPIWAHHRGRFMYGVPDHMGRGFKISEDSRGPTFDPSSGERTVDPETLRRIRHYMGFRFPGMRNAPLIETRVCQYEDTPDRNLIIDRHPKADNVWLVGGGSGHGFKHGPAVGEILAQMVLNGGNPDAVFRLARFGQ